MSRAKKTRLDAVYVIFDTVEKRLWSSKANTKIGWISTGAAKNAWNLGRDKWDEEGRRISNTFDTQTRYIVVCIHELLVQSLVEES